MKLLSITALLILTSCSMPNPNIDEDLNRYIDKEMGVVCYTIDKHAGISCLQSNKLQLESFIEDNAFTISPNKDK